MKSSSKAWVSARVSIRVRVGVGGKGSGYTPTTDT